MRLKPLESKNLVNCRVSEQLRALNVLLLLEQRYLDEMGTAGGK
jgi:hypothetical protein